MSKHDFSQGTISGISLYLSACTSTMNDCVLTTEALPFAWEAGFITAIVRFVEVQMLNIGKEKLKTGLTTAESAFNTLIIDIGTIDDKAKGSIETVESKLDEISTAIGSLTLTMNGYSNVSEPYVWKSDREAVMYYFKDYVTGYNPDTDTYEYNWSRIAALFRGIKNPKQFEESLENGVYYKLPSKDLENINSGSQSENLTEDEYKQLCIILNSFVHKDGSIDAEQLQTFLELGCTDGNLMTIEGVSDYQTDCGSVLRELSKYARKENSVISIGLESMLENETEIPKSIMLVNNILIATATAKPTPQGHYYDLHLAPKPIVIQQPYNPVGAVVNPSSTQPLVVGYEEPEPFKPQKRINITLKKSTIADGDISVWSVGDFATVYEYSGDATDVLKDVRSKYINYAEQKANDKVDTLKVSVPKSGLDFTDTGTFLDGTGMVLDIIGCIPVAAEITNLVETGLNITSLTVDTVSLINDSNPQTEAAYEQHKQVESIKTDISEIFANLSKKIDEIDKLSAKLEYSGAYFSAIYYNKSGSVSLPDYNISTDDLVRYVRVYNEKAIAKNSNITDESSKLPVLDEQKIASGDLSEFKQYISIYLDTLSKGDLLDDIK